MLFYGVKIGKKLWVVIVLGQSIYDSSLKHAYLQIGNVVICTTVTAFTNFHEIVL